MEIQVFSDYTQWVNIKDLKNNIDDISFFIIHTYLFYDYIIDYYYIKEIMIKIIKNIYTKFMTDEDVLEILKKDEWALYYNNKRLLEKQYKDDLNKIHEFKFSLKENYKEILKEMIQNAKNNI